MAKVNESGGKEPEPKKRGKPAAGEHSAFLPDEVIDKPVIPATDVDEPDGEVTPGPVASVPPPPADDELEPAGWADQTSTQVFFRPSIICGRCETCGSAHYKDGKVVYDIIDGKKTPRLEGGRFEEMDATNCPHYGHSSPFRRTWEQGRSPIQCHYCGEAFTGAKNKLGKFTEILATRCLYVVSLRKDPKRVIMYCDAPACKDKHLQALKQGSTS